MKLHLFQKSMMLALAAVAVAGVAGAAGGVAHAATLAEAATSSSAVSVPAAPSVPADTCGVTTDDVAQIAAVRNNPSLSASQEVVQELALRKQLVERVISCAQGQIAALRTELNAVTTTDDSARSLQSQLAGRLNDADNFYSLQLGKLDDSGIAGTEAVASDVLSWRTGTYGPLAGRVNDFVLWAGNQSLFATAQARMDQTQQAVSFLENASANTNLQSAFNSAYASFESAKQDNDAAKAALQQSLSPDQALDLIKQSLSDLQATYQQFFTVSGIIQTLLPQ